MEYVNLGRKLGIGTRVAAKILRDRAQNGAARAKASKVATQEQTHVQQGQPAQPRRQIGPRKSTRDVTRGFARGSRGFGQGFWKPFSRAVRALWHEVTGVFFAIFALFFAQNLWRVRDAWRSGPEHHHFVLYLVFLLVFAYFSITAFITSHRSQRQ